MAKTQVVEGVTLTTEGRANREPWDGELFQEDWPRKKQVEVDFGSVDTKVFFHSMTKVESTLPPVLVGIAYAPEGLAYYLVTGEGRLYSRYLNFCVPPDKNTSGTKREELPKSEWTRTRWHLHVLTDENGQEVKDKDGNNRPMLFTGWTVEQIAAHLTTYRQCQCHTWKDMVTASQMSKRERGK